MPPYQCRGLATGPGRSVIAEAAAAGTNGGRMPAYPSPGSSPSNVLCRNAGLALLNEIDFKYSRGI